MLFLKWYSNSAGPCRYDSSPWWQIFNFLLLERGMFCGTQGSLWVHVPAVFLKFHILHSSNPFCGFSDQRAAVLPPLLWRSKSSQMSSLEIHSDLWVGGWDEEIWFHVFYLNRSNNGNNIVTTLPNVFFSSYDFQSLCWVAFVRRGPFCLCFSVLGEVRGIMLDSEFSF